MVVSGVLLALPGPAGARGPAPVVVPAAVAAYGQVGTLGIAVTRQAPRLPPGAVRADALALSGALEGAGADRPFPAASLVKLFVAEDVLHRARAGLLSLTQADFALLQNMIRRSDDPAASALWVRFGGGRMVADVAARYGLTGTTPPAVPGQWGLTTTTAQDVARFLAQLPVTAHPSDASALLVWMRTATPLAADGYDQRFGLFGTVPGLPAVKQGWMCCVRGNIHLHSVAVVGSSVVVLLSEVPRSAGYDAARTALTAAAAALPHPARP
jgi:hypothetical protein